MHLSKTLKIFHAAPRGQAPTPRPGDVSQRQDNQANSLFGWDSFSPEARFCPVRHLPHGKKSVFSLEHLKSGNPTPMPGLLTGTLTCLMISVVLPLNRHFGANWLVHRA